jgi:hypothetical protein
MKTGTITEAVSRRDDCGQSGRAGLGRLDDRRHRRH